MKPRQLAAPVLFVAVLAVLLAAVPIPAAAAPQHTVIVGDNLHLLAAYYYRDPRRWTEIWSANKTAVRKPSLLRPGAVLVIPDRGLRAFPEPYAEWRAKVLN